MAFALLHPLVQRKLWDMKWTELRPIQVDAIEHLRGTSATDCILASPTASGKTEAAFLPVLSSIADDPGGSVRAVYIGPLKALIDDQFGRIEDLCARMEMPVHRWHGDVGEAARRSLLQHPAGVLLITPESMEAMFVLRPTEIPRLFGHLQYVVIDEMHAFLGTPRGAQLISQLHRLRLRTARDPIRIGLSATLGDADAAKRWLRRDGRPVRVIESPATSSEIRLRVRGVWRTPPSESELAEDAGDPSTAEVARGILLACRGDTNLIFANSKSLIEALGDELATQAKASGITDEIVVHHGSLSKDERAHAEERLRSGRPCTAVCSNTLELGIDIGAIDQVIQVSAPWSVATLVQRLGRSGRRPGSARILRGYFIENVPKADASPWERLHLGFVRALASIELLLAGWLEAPDVDRSNLSTLVQQVLSSLAETGGLRAQELHARVDGSGAFPGVQRAEFAAILRELGARDLIEQMPDSSLVLGIQGQRIVGHYSFYAAFDAPTELQVLHRDRAIGMLPASMLPGEGEHVILAGRRWQVDQIDLDRKQVFVTPSRGRRPPRFVSEAGDIAARVHVRMRALLLDDTVPAYLDDTGREILQHARAAARDASIETPVHVFPDRSVLSLWAGTRIHRTLSIVLACRGLEVESPVDVALDVLAQPSEWTKVLRQFVDAPDPLALAKHAETKLHARFGGDKYDSYLATDPWRAAYLRERLDLDGASRVALRLLSESVGAVRSEPPRTTFQRVVSIPSIDRWAAAISALPVREPFPTRIVLVPSEAHSHALRAHLAARTPKVLVGTRFFTAAAAARAVLDAAGVRYADGEEHRRRLRVRKVLRMRPILRGYSPDAIQTKGWEEAFASTIDQLESAGLRPEHLDALDEPRSADLATIWRALELDAGSSWTVPRMMIEAARLLEDPRRWPFEAHTLSAVSLGIDAVHARLVRAIPRLTLGISPGRPARRRSLDRVHALLGPAAAALIGEVSHEATNESELELLKTLMFEGPDALTAPKRRRSSGPDGSVTLELHAGVDHEIEAAAAWVSREVFEHGTPLQDLAILVPSPDPLAVLVADRIRALAWPQDVEPVYLEVGRPASSTSSGARLRGVIDALRSFLPAEAIAELLPRLRLDGRDHLWPDAARTVVAAIGTLGGSSARPTEALSWRSRETDNEDVRAITPALDALVAVAAEMLASADLRALWRGVRDFARTHLIGTRELTEILGHLDQEVEALCVDDVADHLRGVAAVEWIGEALDATRLHRGRFGDPSIYVGTIDGAAGLAFTSVRVLGLAEGAFPGTLREDALLPGASRKRLDSRAMPADDDHTASRLHAFDQVVRGARERLVLSTPRTDLDGSEREPAALFVEVAAALARPDAVTGAPSQRIVPTLFELERDAFRPARATSIATRQTAPLSTVGWLLEVAEHRSRMPSQWASEIVTDPAGIALRASSMHGLLGATPLRRTVPGRETAASASALRVLLSCPQQFLLQRVLGFVPREEMPSRTRLDPLAYGKLFHAICETFYNADGSAFGRHEQSLETWLARVETIAADLFERHVADHPLLGAGLVDAERQRLRRDVRTFIEDDWGGGPRDFVRAEYKFKEVALSTTGGSLLLDGAIDRIDIEQGLTLVRDLKTGRVYARDLADPEPSLEIDLQLAIYAAVTVQLAGALGAPADVAVAYAYVDRLAPTRERAYRADRQLLHDAGRRWFDLAAALLRDQTFIKTPDSTTCARCSFEAVCGDETDATTRQLADAVGPLGSFRDLKA